MNQFLANPTFATLVLYYATCLFNFAAALWMAISITRMRGVDLWPVRFVVTLAGLTHVIITVSMFKNPEYAPHATSLIWWWVIALFGLLVLLRPTGVIPESIIRIGSYVGAVLAYWGGYIVFTEQNAFGELATYYGFFGANLTAAIWMVIGSMINRDLLQQKRVVIMGTGAIYAGLVIVGLYTMQMILESPY